MSMLAGKTMSLKKSWAVSWDNRTEANFQASIWLILKHFKLKQSVKIQKMSLGLRLSVP